MILDPYGRPVTNLRLSVTQRCNLRCFYCHKEGENYRARVEMTPEEIESVVRVAASLDINKIKLTGGEPLLRDDIVDIVSRIGNIQLLQEISMTTNGILLSRFAETLKAAGLARINISLGTFDKDVYKAITGVNALNEVMKGIEEAERAGLAPIKINMVILKGLNETQVPAMIDFTKKNNLILQIIELESSNPKDKYYIRYHSDLAEIEKDLEKKSSKIITRRMHKRTKYFLQDGGEVEVVKPMHNTEFCKNCVRLRVTSDGRFKPCLFRTDNLVDFLNPLRNGAMNEDIKSLILKAVMGRKPYFY